MRVEDLLSQVEGFEWDEGNVNKNWGKHRVRTREAEQVFRSVPKVFHKDHLHSIYEERYIVWGKTAGKRRLSVVFTIRNEKIRIISARGMNVKEKKDYEKKVKAYSKV
jgi:uncharacterized DUF497 family protein